jgi:hypothetical protein
VVHAYFLKGTAFMVVTEGGQIPVGAGLALQINILNKRSNIDLLW